MKYLLIIILSFLFITSFASPPKKVYNLPINGVDGRDGIDGKNGSFTQSNFDSVIAITGAMSAIPTSSHVNGHRHTMVGVGIGGYSGAEAVAVGLTHMQEQMSYKANVGFSSGESIYGVGMGYTFD